MDEMFDKMAQMILDNTQSQGLIWREFLLPSGEALAPLLYADMTVDEKRIVFNVTDDHIQVVSNSSLIYKGYGDTANLQSQIRQSMADNKENEITNLLSKLGVK